MNNALRKYSISKIEESIELWNAEECENCCYRLLEAIEKTDLVHRGLTEEGKPCGYTVDIFSNDGKIVCECSAERNYFNSPYSKIRNDIKHALNLYPNWEKLYLISNQVCSSSNLNRVSDIFREIGEDKHIQAVWYDRRLLAETILCEVEQNEGLLIKLKEYIKYLEELYNFYPFQNAIPRYDDYVTNSDKERELENALNKEGIVVVHGLSGGGKSYLASWYACVHRKEYDNIYWIDGKDFESATSLKSLQISRMGLSINLLGQFSIGKNLLIIDSLEKGEKIFLLNELQKGLLNGSKILITSQFLLKLNLQSISIEQSSVSLECASGILNVIPNEKIVMRDKIISRAGSHPLTLRIISSLIKSNISYLENVETILDDLGNITDNNNTELITRLIDIHFEKNKDILAKLKWLESTYFDELFLMCFLGFGFQKIVDLSFLSCNGIKGVFKMHDLIFNCISGQNYTLANPQMTEKQFLSFFEDRLYINDIHFRRSLHFFTNRINSLDFPNNFCLIYLKVLLSENVKNVKFLESISSERISSNLSDEFKISSIIKARESLNLIDHEHYDYTHDTIDEIESILVDNDIIPNKIKHILYHNYGKLLKKIEKYPEARIAFENALLFEANSAHTLLQIARLSQGTAKVNILLKLYNDYINKSSASTTNILATISEFSKDERCWNSLVNNDEYYMPHINNIILDNLMQDYNQPLHTIAILCQRIWYVDPFFVIQLYEVVKIPLLNYSSTSLYDVAHTIKNYAKALREFNSLDQEISSDNCIDNNSLLEQYRLNIREKYNSELKKSLTYYEQAFRENDNKNPFDLTLYAECLILHHEYERALRILDCCQEENLHYYHRRAQAEYHLNHFSEALVNIDKAIEGGQKKHRYLAAFYESKSDIYQGMNKYREAISFLNFAIESSTNKKYIEHLKTKLKAIEEQFLA